MKGNPFLANKFLWHGIDYVKRLLGDEWLEASPICAEIDPTNLCTHKCVWCMFDEFRYRVRESISSEDMKRVINQLAEAKVKAITFTGGGEPLCNSKVFPDSFYDVAENGMSVGLVTNGSLLGKYVEEISETCTFVRVSLDAATPETHAKLHGAKDFQKITANIRAIARTRNIDVGMAFLVHPYNFQEVQEFCRLGNDLGVDYVQVRPVWMQGLALSQRIVDFVIDDIKKAAETYDVLDVYARMDRFAEILERKKGFRDCLATPLVAVIGADLNVYLCCQFRGFSNRSFGSLKESSFKEIWHGERRRQMVTAVNVDKCPPCRYRTYNVTLSQLREAAHVDFL